MIELVRYNYQYEDQIDHLNISPFYLKKYTNKGVKYQMMKRLGVMYNEFYLFIKDGVVCGMIVLRKKISSKLKRDWWIYGVFITDAMRGKGLGKALMEAAFVELKSRRARRVLLKVECSNKPAISLYKKCDLQEVGNDSMNIIMRKSF